MKQISWTVVVTSLPIIVAMQGCAQDDAASLPVTDEDRPFLLNYPNLDDPDGRVVLTNEYVVLQRLYVPAGEWEGLHSHPGNQIYVHIVGGEWSGRLGGEVEYWGIPSPDGEVGWMDPIPLEAGHNSGNTGDTPIDLIYVTLKKDVPIAASDSHEPQVYPDLDLALVLENDRLIAQRVFLEPGQWTGVHEHPGKQVFLVIKGGILSERRGGESFGTEMLLEAGAVGWIDPLDNVDVHNVGNTGDTTMEIVLVTVK